MKDSNTICQICQPNDVEVELHFLFSCNAYKQERNQFKLEVNVICQNTINITNMELLIYCCEKEYQQLAKYICTVFEKRKSQALQLQIYTEPYPKMLLVVIVHIQNVL